MGGGGKDQRDTKRDAGCGTTILGRHQAMNEARTRPGKATRELDTGMDKMVKQNSKEMKKSKYCNLTHNWKSSIQNCCVRGRKRGKKKNRGKKKIKESLLVPKCGYYLKAVEMGVACEMRWGAPQGWTAGPSPPISISSISAETKSRDCKRQINLYLWCRFPSLDSSTLARKSGSSLYSNYWWSRINLGKWLT